MKVDKKGLRARLDDIYKWSVKSGVAIVTPNSLKVQWDKVIEELNELLYHCNGNGNRDSLNWLWKNMVIDDIGDILISFINLLNIDSNKTMGVFSKNSKRMALVEKSLLTRVTLSPYTVAQIRNDKMFVVDEIFDVLHFAHLHKGTHLSSRDLFGFFDRLIYLFKVIIFKFDIKVSLRNCIYSSFLEIQGRKYEIRVR